MSQFTSCILAEPCTQVSAMVIPSNIIPKPNKHRQCDF